MNTGMIPTRYAAALLAYASESGHEEQLYETAKTTLKSFEEQARLTRVLQNGAEKTTHHACFKPSKGRHF